MALNFPGPQELRFFYSSGVPNLIEHVQKLNIQTVGQLTPGQDLSAVQVLRADNSQQLLTGVIDDWKALLQPCFNTADTISRVEIWQYAPQSFDATFIGAESLLLAGTHLSADLAAGQQILTFRTREGGIMKIVLMETPFPPGLTQPSPSPVAIAAIANFTKSTITPFLGRDTSPPIALIAYHPGQSEKIFKVRFR